MDISLPKTMEATLSYKECLEIELLASMEKRQVSQKGPSVF